MLSKNLKIESATQQYAMDNKLATAAAMTDWKTPLVGSALYIKTEPKCPSSGTYTTTTIDAAPACSATTTAYPHTVNGQ